MGVLWNWNLDNFCLMIIEMFIQKFDCFITIEGCRSLGKSTLAIKISKKVSSYIKRIAAEIPEYKKLYEFSLQNQVNNPKKYKYVLYKRDDILNFFNEWNRIAIGDEAINVCFNREFYAEDQKNLIKLINMNRDHLNLFIMCIPQFQVLDNQIKNLCKIRISVVRRGLAVIQTPNKIIYGRDKWDSNNNEKIEREWQMSATKRPRYTRLTTFRGILKFSKLSDKDEALYQSIKNNERNIIRKSLGINDNEEEKDIVDEVIDRLNKGGIKNMEFIKGVAAANNQTIEQLRGKVRRKLDAKKMDNRISHYFTDKKAKDLGEIEDHI